MRAGGSDLHYLKTGGLAWLAAAMLSATASALAYGERPSATDLVGFGLATLVTATVLVLACYLPGFWLLKRRVTRRLSAPWVAATSGLALNLPAFAVLALVANRMDAFAAGETLWFALFVLLFGLGFGLGWGRYRERTA